LQSATHIILHACFFLSIGITESPRPFLSIDNTELLRPIMVLFLQVAIISLNVFGFDSKNYEVIAQG
jgi:hypothetical protein